MKKIVILSDTHGNLRDLEKLSSILQEADQVLFAGDGANDFNIFPPEIYKKIKIVSGNCDFSSHPKELVFNIENKRVLLCHGDRYGVKSGLIRLFLRAKELKCDLVVYGHTHNRRIEEKEGILFVNPGTLSKFAPYKTFAYTVFSENKIIATINENFFNA